MAHGNIEDANNKGPDGYFEPNYPHDLGRPLTHDEMDFNLDLIGEIIKGYRVMGTAPNGEMDIVNDLDKVLKLYIVTSNDTDLIAAGAEVDDIVWVPGVASGGNGGGYYQNPNPTTATNLEGYPVGSTFPNPVTFQQMWDDLLYPYVAPGADLIATPSPIEYGDYDTVAGKIITLNWTATRHSNAITGIFVDGVVINPVTGNTQSGNQTTLSTHPINPGISHTQTYTMQVADGTSTTTETASVIWMNQVYWGRIDLGGVNFTTNPSATVTITDNDILNLDGAGVGTGSILTTTKNLTFEDLSGQGDHLIWAWPSNLPGAQSPVFTVNGLKNTAFTQVRTNSPFTNQHGFTTNYEVWVINTVQNSPVAEIIIS